MSLILNLETATERCSVCLSENEKILSLKEAPEDYSHSKVLTLLIRKSCEEIGISLKDIDAVAISRGPGSYTALRVGTSVAKGICYGLNKKLIAVDTLQSIAYATAQKEKKDALYVPMIDARRSDVYSAIFDSNNNPVTQTEFKVIGESSYHDYFASENLLIFSGNGAEKCKSLLTSPLAQFSSVICSAANMPQLSHKSFTAQVFENLAYFTPNYHKAPNITIPKRRLL